MAFGGQLPGESAAQYAQRMGIAPNDMSEFLASIGTGNAQNTGNAPAQLTNFQTQRNTPQTQASADAWKASGFGTGVPAYRPLTVGPQLNPADMWQGQTPGANTPGGVSLGSLAGGMGRGTSSLPTMPAAPMAQTASAGAPAMAGMGGVNGVPGYGGTFDINNWKDPGYDFRLGEGQKLLEGSAAARGNLLSGPTLKALTNYGQDAASQEYNNAFNRFTGNRAFNYGVDTGDRAFDYLTRTGDRDFNYQSLKDLASLGQFGAAGGANSNNLLATLLSQNTLAGGNAAGAGTIGAGNAISGGLQQALAQMLQQNYLNRYLPQPG